MVKFGFHLNCDRKPLKVFEQGVIKVGICFVLFFLRFYLFEKEHEWGGRASGQAILFI